MIRMTDRNGNDMEPPSDLGGRLDHAYCVWGLGHHVFGFIYTVLVF